MIKYLDKIENILDIKVISLSITPSVDRNYISGRNVCYIGWKAAVNHKGKVRQFSRYWPCRKNYTKHPFNQGIFNLISEDFSITMYEVYR